MYTEQICVRVLCICVTKSMVRAFFNHPTMWCSGGLAAMLFSEGLGVTLGLLFHLQVQKYVKLGQQHLEKNKCHCVQIEMGAAWTAARRFHPTTVRQLCFSNFLQFPLERSVQKDLIKSPVEKRWYHAKTRWSPRTRMLTRMLMVQMSKHMVMQSRTIPFCNSLFEQSCTCFPCYQSAVWSGKCRAWSVECEVRSVECKVWSGECRVCKV